MTDFEDNSFTFNCDFDQQNNRWWFEDKGNNKKFYISGDIIPEDYECNQATEELINTQLKSIYPNYDFYDYKTNTNGRIYNPNTNELIPSFAFTVIIFYNKKIIEDYFVFSCDYDKNINKWWFKNQKNQETFYVDENPSYNVINECYYKTQELINTQLKLKYPNYDFYDIKTNMNAHIYDKETDTFNPTYDYTVLINFRYNPE